MQISLLCITQTQNTYKKVNRLSTAWKVKNDCNKKTFYVPTENTNANYISLEQTQNSYTDTNFNLQTLFKFLKFIPNFYSSNVYLTFF